MSADPLAQLPRSAVRGNEERRLARILWLIGGQALRTVAFILAGCLGLALVIGASALPIRAYRRSDANPIVEHHYHDGTVTKEVRILDGRMAPEVKLLQAPGQNGQMYPELLRATYQSGALAAGRDQANTVDAASRLVDDDGWAGRIGQ